MKKIDISALSEVENPYVADPRFKEYADKLTEMRADHEARVAALKDEINDIKLNNQISKEDKKTLIQQNNDMIDEALGKKHVAELTAEINKYKEQGDTASVETKSKELEEYKQTLSDRKKELTDLVNKACKESDEAWKPYYEWVVASENNRAAEAKATYASEVADLNSKHANHVSTIKSRTPSEGEDVAEFKEKNSIELKAENNSYKSKLLEAKRNRNEVLASVKDNKFAAYMEKYGYNGKKKENVKLIEIR